MIIILWYFIRFDMMDTFAPTDLPPQPTHVWTQDQLCRPMKVPVEVVPKQTAFDEIAGRPVVDELVVPVAPNFVS